MKKVTSSLAAIAVAVSFSIAPVSADPGKGPANDTVDFCKAITDAGITSSVGECMGILRSDDAPSICKLWDFQGVLELIGFKNRGDCVSTLRELGV